MKKLIISLMIPFCIICFALVIFTYFNSGNVDIINGSYVFSKISSFPNIVEEVRTIQYNFDTGNITTGIARILVFPVLIIIQIIQWFFI